MQFIDLHRQFEQIEQQIHEGIDRVLKHKKFIMGPEVSELEEELAMYTGVKHVITCASGTDALKIPLMAMNLSKEDAIFVPSFTFFASAEAVTLAGGTPVFVDSDKNTFNMDADSLDHMIKKVISEGELVPKGIIPVDLFGLPANHSVINKLAKEYDMFILEDAAQGFGGEIKGKKATSFGNVSATSFFPAKPLGCYGDGGAVFTDDDDLAAEIKSIHIHGQGVDKYDNVQIGLNSRLDTIQAVVLKEKLKIFPKEIEQRNYIANMYTEILAEVIKTPDIPNGYISSWAQYTLQADDKSQRDTLVAALQEANIPVMVYYSIPVHQSIAYKDTVNYKLPFCEMLKDKVFSIPMHPYLTDKEVMKICAVIKKTIKGK